MTLLQTLTFPGDKVKIEGPITAETIDKNFGGQLTLGSIISRALDYVFPFAGLILLIMLIIGGFQILLSKGNPEAVKAGQDKVVSALIGFVIIFLAYWLMQIIQTVLGFHILG